MRLIFTLALASFALICSAQKFTTTAQQNGNWDAASTWDNGVPENGDIVEIPRGITVSVVRSPYNQNPEANRPRLTINLQGTLSFATNGSDKLFLNNGSIIQLFPGAAITSNGSSSTEIIAIYSGTGNTDNMVFDNDPSTIHGPGYATATSPGFVVGVLPIKLKSFTAETQKNQIALKWSTEEEQNAARFEVERSTDARTWNTLEIVGARGSGTHYTVIDAAPVRGENLYRLKLVDLDGTTELSSVVKVNTSKSRSVQFSPNPATNFITITLSGITSSPVQVQLLGTKGQVVKEAVYRPQHANFFTFDLQGVSKGLYTLIIRAGDGLPEASQLVVR